MRKVEQDKSSSRNEFILAMIAVLDNATGETLSGDQLVALF